MRLSELANEPVAVDPDITGITADSREIVAGNLFAALPGVEMDGAKFIPQAEARGAAAVLSAPGVETALPQIVDAKPRQRLSTMAASFYAGQPEVIAGITGTNGKTSTARFISELWSLLGKSAGSLGTIGAVAKNFSQPLIHTTPDPVTLHQTLHAMTNSGVTHLAMEVSSHGLAQFRADGVGFSVAAFTNISQDHLDYHKDFTEYFDAKLRLFADLVPTTGAIAVNMDGKGAFDVCKVAEKRQLRLITTGAQGNDIKLLDATPHQSGQSIKVAAGGREWVLDVSLIGAFQIENALLAAGVVIAAGNSEEEVIPLLASLSGVPGRMEHVADVQGGSVYVDYAHTPDAVETALKAIRPHTRARIIAIIGAGGDRDKEKRPLMGKAAADNADTVIVTDDNPRMEDPAVIRAAVLKGCPAAQEIGDRKEAIEAGVKLIGNGDVLVIAGKGHETGQSRGGEVTPFDDAAIARAAAKRRTEEIGK